MIAARTFTQFALAFALSLSYLVSARAIEEPDYTVVESFGEFELRQYDTVIVADVAVSGEFNEVGDTAFGILFDYISGNNLPGQNIEMTAPVIQQTDQGEKIEMTAPVLQQPSDGESRYVFSFVMPSAYSLDTIPMSVDQRISIREVPPKLIAARTYSGRWSQRNYDENERILAESLLSQNLQPIANPIFARYNSPFSLWFMRRNEVLIEVEQI